MDQKPFRTLFIWMIWASAALVVYVALYQDTDVWSFVEHDASRITWIIITMFLLGVIASFALTLMITKEAYRATQVEEAARAGGLNAIIIQSAHRATDRFFQSIKNTVESKGQPDTEKLLNVQLAVFERISHTVEVIGSLLITLGLIGTVMGLTMTLTGLTGSIEALGHDQEKLLSGLRAAMGGMGTAFYNTLLGAVLGGVLLRVFAQINQHGVEALHNNLIRICLVYCANDYAPTLERDVRMLSAELQALEQQLTSLQSSFQNSFGAMREFRDEMGRFIHGSPEEGSEPLRRLIHEHRVYCDMLREEMRLMMHQKRPWWVRLIEVLRAPRA